MYQLMLVHQKTYSTTAERQSYPMMLHCYVTSLSNMIL